MTTRYSTFLYSLLLLALTSAGCGASEGDAPIDGGISAEGMMEDAGISDPDRVSADPDLGPLAPDLSTDGPTPSTGTLQVAVSAPQLCWGRMSCQGWLYVSARTGFTLGAPALAETHQEADLSEGKVVTITLEDVPAGTMYVVAIFRRSGPIGHMPSITAGDMATGLSKFTLKGGEVMHVPRVINHQFEECWGRWVDQAQDCRSPTDELYPTSCCEGMLCGGSTHVPCAKGLVCQGGRCAPQ